ncbi:hypothetical protein XELAEV_18007364mg [Xenopus laevis]|uniref:G-protein coupled receptors family 1 profile domain-containing protein n=1 Tax=Xenopus laevis TaxID=8355 RepID=A0A974E1J8_XENLA|nr:hypothetical protein XELAEV_18007364mg [Xenopus laevis]
MNHTSVYAFILLGLSSYGQYQIPMFTLFFCISLLTLSGNITIFEIIRRNRNLHMPMYFFLSHLSLLDMTSSFIIIPKMLANYLSSTQIITFAECLTQLHLFITFLATECFLLTVMAYDRYVAICNPLHYSKLMKHTNCIKHYFCDLPPLLYISCTNILPNVVAIFLGGILIGIGSFVFTVFSYIKIILNILKIKSVKGRFKAFSTCASHITVFTLFISTLIAVYFQSLSTYSLNNNRLLSLVYTVLTPLLNPFIYSVRNTDVKRAIRSMILQKKGSELVQKIGVKQLHFLNCNQGFFGQSIK